MEDKKIADVSDVQAFWTSVMYDGFEKMIQRLKASELLARSYGMFKDYVKPEYAPSAIDAAMEGLTTEELRRLVYGDDCKEVG